MTQKHTPTPWALTDEKATIAGSFTELPTGERAQYTIGHLGRRGESVNSTDEANAAFIVRACNAHDELVACLDNAYGLLHAQGSYSAFEDRILKALAKARGEA